MIKYQTAFGRYFFALFKKIFHYFSNNYNKMLFFLQDNNILLLTIK
nr:MAG TPA: hypothetical protein [Caudoviricetes sp.]